MAEAIGRRIPGSVGDLRGFKLFVVVNDMALSDSDPVEAAVVVMGCHHFAWLIVLRVKGMYGGGS